MMNDIRWSEHPLYADVVKRVPPELHPTLARAVDLRAADAWLHEGTMPAGLDSDGKSLGGQQGPAFLRAAGRRYMRRWVTNEHGEQFGKGEAGMLFDKWLDEMLAFSAGAGRTRTGHLVAAGTGGGDPRSGRQPERRAADVPLLHGQGSLREQGPGALFRAVRPATAAQDVRADREGARGRAHPAQPPGARDAGVGAGQQGAARRG